MYAKNRTQITGLSASTWNTVSLGSFITVEPGCNAALIAVSRASGTVAGMGARKVGTSEAVVNDNRRYYVKLIELVDNQVELYGNAALYFIIGVGQVNFLSPINKALAQSNTWQTVDLSGDGIPSSAAFVIIRSDANFAIRRTGETFDSTAPTFWARSIEEFAVVPIDEYDTFEVNNGNLEGTSLDVIGWLPAGAFEWIDNAPLRQTSLASTWEDLPDTAPAGVTIAMVEMRYNHATTSLVNVRTKGGSDSLNYNPDNAVWWVQPDGSGEVQIYDSQQNGYIAYFTLRGGFKVTSNDEVSGDLDATESGSDVFEAEGVSSSTGLRVTLRDTDTGAVHAHLSDLIVSVRENSDDEATLYKTTDGSTDEDGILEFASATIGDIGDYVYLTVETDDHSIVATYRLQVIDLNV
jgi:hypothetical protein